MSSNLLINPSYKKIGNSIHCHTTTLIFGGHLDLLISLITFIKNTCNWKFIH